MPLKPRLLVLTSTFPRWRDDPEPPFVFELSRRLTDTFEITVLAPRAPGSLSEEQMDGLRVIRFGYFFRRWENLATHGGGILNRLRLNPWNYLLVPFFLAGQFWALTRLLRREPFEVIHSHWIIPQGFVARLALARSPQRPNLVCTSHGGDLYALNGKFLNWLKLWVIRESQNITVVSSAMREHLIELGVGIDKVEVIPMGTDLRRQFIPCSKQTREDNRLLFIGRLVEKKGADILLSAMPLILRSCPDIRLSIVGAGPLTKALRDQSRRLGLIEHVDFLGMLPKDQLPTLYRQATIFVAPFRVASSGDREGLGLVMVEALGCECPVIASDLPAVHDVVINGKTGLLVQQERPTDLANAVIQLLKSPEKRSQLAKAGRQHCLDHFDSESVTQKYANLLASAAHALESG